MRVLAVQEDRVVQNDWTVRWHNAFLQLPRESQVQPGERVVVCEQIDGRVRVFIGDRELTWGSVRTEPSRPRKREPAPSRSHEVEPGLETRGEPSLARPSLGYRLWGTPPAVVDRLGAVCSASVAALPALRKPPPNGVWQGTFLLMGNRGHFYSCPTPLC